MTVRSFIVLGALTLVSARQSEAQFPPDSLINLEVLSPDLTVREVINVMRGFSLGLGVRCRHCHVGEEGQPLSEFDFASDDKAAKRRARVMLEMMNDINETYLTRLPERTTPEVAVQCATCHRANSRPVMIEDVLVQTMDDEGVDAAKAKYRELREQYYGSFTYDFTELTLSLLAQGLAGAGQFDRAIAALELNEENFSESAGIQFLFGEVYRGKGETDRAAGYYERALELNPNMRPAQQRLAQLRGN